MSERIHERSYLPGVNPMADAVLRIHSLMRERAAHAWNPKHRGRLRHVPRELIQGQQTLANRLV